MKEFDDIFLSWRQGQGNQRFIIGKLSKGSDNKFSFNYIKENVESAKKKGFSPYTEFPSIEKVYNGNVLEIFAQRLIKPERTDIQTFYDFWEIDSKYKDDKYYLLAHTQGLSTTDNFEFLADYNPIPGLHFLTELAKISIQQLPVGSIKINEELQYELEPNNQFDSNAVKVLQSGRELGYIKRIHNKVFYKRGGENLKLIVKALDQNGTIKRIFVKVSRA